MAGGGHAHGKVFRRDAGEGGRARGRAWEDLQERMEMSSRAVLGGVGEEGRFAPGRRKGLRRAPRMEGRGVLRPTPRRAQRPLSPFPTTPRHRWRRAGSISDVSGLKRVLRSNGWPRDGLSAASPWDAICARGDLDPEDPDAYGCFDGKVTNYRCAERDGCVGGCGGGRVRGVGVEGAEGRTGRSAPGRVGLWCACLRIRGLGWTWGRTELEGTAGGGGGRGGGAGVRSGSS